MKIARFVRWLERTGCIEGARMVLGSGQGGIGGGAGRRGSQGRLDPLGGGVCVSEKGGV